MNLRPRYHSSSEEHFETFEESPLLCSRLPLNPVMKILKALTMGLCLMAFTVFGSWAHGQDASSGESKWEFTVTPYFWMAGIDGDVGVKGVTSHVDYSFSDILDQLDYGGEVHVEAWKSNLGIFFDATYLKLSADATVSPLLGPIDVDADMDEWLVGFGGLYRFAKWPLGKEEGRALSLESVGGGRYWYLKGKLDASAPLVGLARKVEGSKDWIDPIIGLRLRADLTKKLSLALRGDIGGFGVGSDFSWNASAIFGYSFSDLISVWLGYRALGVDYESGSGRSKFKFDVTMYGPIVGLGFRF